MILSAQSARPVGDLSLSRDHIITSRDSSILSLTTRHKSLLTKCRLSGSKDQIVKICYGNYQVNGYMIIWNRQ